MTTTQLESFVAVAETLSFARAAERLHISQPTVTHHVKSLEAELGCQLFQRTTRHVSLTDNGRLFLPDAESILSTARRATGRFRRGNRVSAENLRVGCRSYAHATPLANVFRAMAGTHDHLRPDIIVVPHEHLHQLLEDNEIDVALDFFDTGRAHEQFEEVIAAAAVVICPSDHELAGRDRLWPDALATCPLALTRPDRLPVQVRSSMQRVMSARRSDIDYLCDSVEAALTIVLAGLAVSVHPDISVPNAPGLARIPLEGAERAPFGAYTLNGSKSPLVDEFIELYRAQLQG